MSIPIVIRYALLAMPLAFLGLPLYVYVPTMYAELPLVGLSMAGLVLLLARLFDLITDPLVGYFLDRWRHQVHPMYLIAAGCPVLMVGVFKLFNPDADSGPLYLAGYVFLSYLGLTLVSIPYYAWGAEIGRIDNQHRQLAAWREAGVITGTLLALMVAAVAAEGDALKNMSWVLLFILPVCLLALLSLKRTHPKHSKSDWRLSRLWQDLDRGSSRLLRVHFLNTLAAGMPATLFLLYVNQVLGLDALASGLLLLLYFVCAVVALPLWVRIARRWGEILTWRTAILIAAVGFLPAAFLQAGDTWIFVLVCMLTGATLGADVAIPAAMQARFATGVSSRQSRPREASAFGLWGMASKLALALAVGITLPLLDLFPEGDKQVTALALLYALLPVSVKLLAAWQLSRFHGVLHEALRESNPRGDNADDDNQMDGSRSDLAAYRM